MSDSGFIVVRGYALRTDELYCCGWSSHVNHPGAKFCQWCGSELGYVPTPQTLQKHEDDWIKFARELGGDGVVETLGEGKHSLLYVGIISKFGLGGDKDVAVAIPNHLGAKDTEILAHIKESLIDDQLPHLSNTKLLTYVIGRKSM